MPLTNAQKQAAHRARRDAKMARYEAALREIVNADGIWADTSDLRRTAREALNPTTE